MTKVVTLILVNQLVALGLDSGDAAFVILAGAIGGIFLSIIAAVGFVRIMGGVLAFLANIVVLVGLFLIFLAAIMTLALLPVAS